MKGLLLNSAHEFLLIFLLTFVKLAILDDDGCRIFINRVRLLFNNVMTVPVIINPHLCHYYHLKQVWACDFVLD